MFAEVLLSFTNNEKTGKRKRTRREKGRTKMAIQNQDNRVYNQAIQSVENVGALRIGC